MLEKKINEAEATLKTLTTYIEKLKKGEKVSTKAIILSTQIGENLCQDLKIIQAYKLTDIDKRS